MIFDVKHKKEGWESDKLSIALDFIFSSNTAPSI